MCCLCDVCDCFCGTLRAGCCILVFVAVPIAVIALVALSGRLTVLFRLISLDKIQTPVIYPLEDPLAMCFPSKEFKKEHPVAAQTIKCFKKTSSAACRLLVFVAAPTVVIVLVSLGKISPWWLFLGCAPLVLLACAGCYVCFEFCTDFLRELDEKNAAENCEISIKPPTQAAPV